MIAPSGAFCRLKSIDHSVIGESLVTQLGWTYLDVLFQSSKVQTDGLLIEVPVLTDLEARVAEDWSVVTPRWRGEVNNLGGREEASQEGTPNSKSSSTGKRLGNGDLSSG